MYLAGTSNSVCLKIPSNVGSIGSEVQASIKRLAVIRRINCGKVKYDAYR